MMYVHTTAIYFLDPEPSLDLIRSMYSKECIAYNMAQTVRTEVFFFHLIVSYMGVTGRCE